MSKISHRDSEALTAYIPLEIEIYSPEHYD